MDQFVNMQPRDVIGERPWTDGFLRKPGNVWPWGVQHVSIPHETSGELSNAPTAIEESDMIMPDTPCLNVQHFNCIGRCDDHPMRDG